MTNYIVKQGDCIRSIAHINGFQWETLWLHEKNNKLKNLRQNPSTLMPGDEVYIPDIRQFYESCAANNTHCFRKLDCYVLFSIQVSVCDNPLANQSFEALIDNGDKHVGTTDKEGWVKFQISPTAKSGELWVGEPDEFEREHIFLNFGCLDPIGEISGLQQRLENIGICVGEENILDEETSAAITEFQGELSLQETGKPDKETLEKLKKVYGS